MLHCGWLIPHLVVLKVDREGVYSVFAEVTREHVTRARPVSKGVRHGAWLPV